MLRLCGKVFTCTNQTGLEEYAEDRTAQNKLPSVYIFLHGRIVNSEHETYLSVCFRLIDLNITFSSHQAESLSVESPLPPDVERYGSVRGAGRDRAVFVEHHRRFRHVPVLQLLQLLYRVSIAIASQSHRFTTPQKKSQTNRQVSGDGGGGAWEGGIEWSGEQQMDTGRGGDPCGWCAGAGALLTTYSLARYRTSITLKHQLRLPYYCCCRELHDCIKDLLLLRLKNDGEYATCCTRYEPCGRSTQRQLRFSVKNASSTICM